MQVVALTMPSRPAIFLIVVMSMSLSTSAFPQPNLQPFHRNPPPAGQEDPIGEQWEMLYPSLSLLNWGVQMLPGPDFGAIESRTQQLPVDEWIPRSQSQLEEKLIKRWPGDWLQREGNHEKRNIVVADDAAFRERSKLLTAMERQKWLNSYMQKLLVVNSK